MKILAFTAATLVGVFGLAIPAIPVAADTPRVTFGWCHQDAADPSSMAPGQTGTGPAVVGEPMGFVAPTRAFGGFVTCSK